jgi:2-oxo-4-hydroxy-4-carboxy-5-ureidoimidazoline decarboxylase
MLAWLNALPPEEAERELLACCASPAWAHRVATARPYADLAALLAAADAAMGRLSWAEIDQALAAHPRIGERAAGAGREAAWSRREQAGMDGAGDQTRTALVEANMAYEERFGHVFLIFASGRSDTEMLASAQARLHHDEATERQVVREELGKISRLRLERLVT